MALTERKCGVSGKRCSLASETLSTLLLPSPRASYPCRRSAEDAEQLFKNSNFLRDRLDQTAMCTVSVWRLSSHYSSPTFCQRVHNLSGTLEQVCNSHRLCNFQYFILSWKLDNCLNTLLTIYLVMDKNDSRFLNTPWDFEDLNFSRRPLFILLLNRYLLK